MLRDDNKLKKLNLSASEKLAYAPSMGPKQKLKGNMGELPFDPSILNIMSMAGGSGGDMPEIEELNPHDGDDDRPASILKSKMTNTRPKVEQVPRLHSAGDDFV